MTIAADGVEIERIPLDDMGVLLCNAHGLTYSNSLMTELASRGVTVVICGRNYLPVAWLWPLDGHHIQALRMRHQLDATRPLCKRLWQAVVKAKIKQQQETLKCLHLPTAELDKLRRSVKSGDPENIEAQAARRYWPLLFGSGFRRSRFGDGPNPLLNYGYTVLRAAVARSVVTAGLHPSLGIHHHNRTNAMCLVDDMMEPFRPQVDLTVTCLVREGQEKITPETKKTLAQVLIMDMNTRQGTTPLQTCLQRAAQSLAKSYATGTPVMDFPVCPGANAMSWMKSEDPRA